jgi:Ni/Co efflux regulator RcnB
MNRMLAATAAALIGLTSLSSAALAQPGPDRHSQSGFDRHDDRGGPPDRGGGHNWRKGQRISHDEWRRYQTVDWRRHHLRQPPRGYEWRQVNGDYVLAAATTGLIASIIAGSR